MGVKARRIALRPFLPADTAVLAALFRTSIEELTGDDYDVDQQEAWAAAADDEAAFGERLAGLLTLIATHEGQVAGFVSLKDNEHIEMLYVHPQAAGMGVGAALCEAAETLARARGAKAMSVDASDSALGFFQQRGYAPQQRNSVSLGDVWLANTSMKKPLGAEARMQ
ncbi:GNAT family N-acetyltransferase [Xanthobacter sp. TB0136]|uniref:GNAT family N-acetyltransferase n=1 Tax=Xanthobacter sp. TB0136 TaxID=3459177 RepID=UPI004039F62E